MTRRMKIGFDGRFLGREPSGNGVFTRMLLMHLAGNDTSKEFVVYMLGSFVHLRQENVQIKKMDLLHRSPHLRFLFTFQKEIRANPVDVFHAIYTVPYNLSTKVVLSLIEFFWITEPHLFPANPLARFQFRLMTLYGIRRADRILVPTHYVRKRLRETFNICEEKVEVVPLGVSESFGEPLSANEISRTLSRHSIAPPYILFVGDLHPRKNIERLVQCYDMIQKQERTPFQLVLVGKTLWGYRKILQSIRRSPYREAIRWIGYVSLDDLRALYQGAHLFVFPSLEEGFGIPPLEAMVSNVPIAASNKSSIPEVVGDGGILFDPLDLEDMKMALLRGLFDESLRSKLTDRGRRRAKGFSWDQSARQTLRIYENLTS